MKVKIQLVVIGILPPEFNIKKVMRWKSELFEFVSPEGYHQLNLVPDNIEWGYSDYNLRQNLPIQNNQERDVLVVYLLDAPIDCNWFSRIFSPNKIVISFYQAKDILKDKYIPFENYILTHLYFYSLLLKRKAMNAIVMEDEKTMVHGARKGCLFDMCGIKEDLPYSCIKPSLCNVCKVKLKDVDTHLLNKVEKELNGLSRGLYYGLAYYLNTHPFITVIVSAIFSAIVSICLSKFF